MAVGIMVGGLTAFRNRAFTRAPLKIISSTHTFSESLLVTEYNHIFEVCSEVNVAVILKKK